MISHRVTYYQKVASVIYIHVHRLSGKNVNLKYMFTCNLNIARLHYMEISVRSTFQIAGRRSLTQEIFSTNSVDQFCR